MWTLCYCVGLILVGAAARTSVHYTRDPRLTSQRPLQPVTDGISDDVPILNSGMNIHESRTDEADIKDTIPMFSSGMNIKKLNDTQEGNDLSVNDEKKTSEENDEQWFSTKPAVLVDTETANNEVVEDEINVQVNVDTAAEVSTEIRRPQIKYSNGKIERNGKLIIKINVKTNKDEPKPLDGVKGSFEKDQNDYDQKTCDWLNELKSEANSNNPRGQRQFNRQQGPQGPQRSVEPQGTLGPQQTLPQLSVEPQGALRLQRTLPQNALEPQGTLRPHRTLPEHALGPQRALRPQRILPQNALKPQSSQGPQEPLDLHGSLKQNGRRPQGLRPQNHLEPRNSK
ncbi:PREDICTED: pre-mRNA 3' end processing protein WDR33-like [Papilio polytes]|uniref:pre-mRNA 3' end processing protein WDR33-like n=1 Tax=Papilio polytes TaxID=76194 RepID=UPI00067659DC|nr:PREDICTED: pre-mRNA 3' end processing protein WDR33-like [Papilio polytes]